MFRSFVLAAAALVVVGLIPPLAGAKAPRPIKLPGQTNAAAAADGVRYGVVVPPDRPGTLAVLDTRSISQAPRSVSSGDCGPAGGAFGRVLLSCGTGAERKARLLRPSTLSLKDVDLPAGTYANQIGRYWLWGIQNDSNFGADYYMPLAAGKTTVVPRTKATLGPQRNLNNPKLGAFSAPIPATATRWVGSESDYTLALRGRGRLLLYKGTKQRETIRCQSTCTTPAIASGYVTWADGKTVHSYELKNRATLSWQLSPVTDVRQPASNLVTAATKYGIVASVLRDVQTDDTPVFDQYFLPFR